MDREGSLPHAQVDE